MNPPTTRYARSGESWIAYQVVGDGPLDLVYTPGVMSNLDMVWEQPSVAHFYQGLASFSRLIIFDRRGQGLSDEAPTVGTLESQVDDLLAVLDAVGSERTALLGSNDGGQVAAMFAASHPERTHALILYGSGARARYSDDFPWGVPDSVWDEIDSALERRLTQGEAGGALRFIAPSVADNEAIAAWYERSARIRVGPGRLFELLKWVKDLDIRELVGSIKVPTLVIRREGDPLASEGQMRDLVERIPGARYVHVKGSDHLEWFEHPDEIVSEVEEFLTGARHQVETDRVLATVLFIDIVSSTERAAELGDRRWRELLERFYDVARQDLTHFRGREIKTTGDGLLATFDGPARAIRCAGSMVRNARALGLAIRTGLHTGECELIGEDVGGIAVHIAARVVDAAEGGEVLVSSTVRDLVAGSGIEFEDRGSRALRGVPGTWSLFAVAT